jgi:hypothetical protein
VTRPAREIRLDSVGTYLQPASHGGSRLATEERQEGSRVEVVHRRLDDS